MIRLMFAVMAGLLAVSAPAAADTRAVYTITDIPVDESAETVVEAQQAAFAEARIVGARRLIQKITLPEDRQLMGGVPIDAALADQLVAAVDVQEETRGGGRYRGVLSVVLNPRTVRSFLQSRDVPYVDRQGPLALLIPVASRNLDARWQNAWPDQIDGALAPVVTARIGGYGRDAGWNEIRYELNEVEAQRGIIAVLEGGEGSWRVRLVQLTAAGNTQLGSTRATSTMEDAALAASAYLDSLWKSQAVVRSGERTLTEANVLYTSLLEWNTLRSALARSPLVSDFQTSAVARDGALVSFAFAGDIQRLRTDLLQRGVDLDPDPLGWVLRSAIAAEPTFR